YDCELGVDSNSFNSAIEEYRRRFRTPTTNRRRLPIHQPPQISTPTCSLTTPAKTTPMTTTTKPPSILRLYRTRISSSRMRMRKKRISSTTLSWMITGEWMGTTSMRLLDWTIRWRMNGIWIRLCRIEEQLSLSLMLVKVVLPTANFLNFSMILVRQVCRSVWYY
ncbi:hypothetical protein LINPERHAP2_LOCUS37652, partial [Linum perenne]